MLPIILAVGGLLVSLWGYGVFHRLSGKLLPPSEAEQRMMAQFRVTGPLGILLAAVLALVRGQAW